MTDVTFKLTQSGMKALLSASFRLLEDPLTVLLLAPSYEPDMNHATFGAVAAHEVTSRDYNRVLLTGAQVSAPAVFRSDPFHFGNPVTIGPVGSVALVGGLPNAVKESSPLLAVGNFLDNGTALESIRGPFTIMPSADGWFALTQP